MKFEIKAYNLQELGQRQNQEDSLYPALGQSTNDDRLFILCDGMGGHEKGEVASATVCEVMNKTILSVWNPSGPLSDEIFQKALAAAYDALDAKDNGEERKMGTTMTFVCLHADGATVAHIGDSRVYQLRPAKNGNPAKIVFRTQDHSLVNDLVKIGEITEEEAKHHPQKNVITRAMQPCQEHRAKADIAHLTDIHPGDYFYMCSDGMLEETTDENILNIITMPGKTDDEKIEMLRNVTEENKDNHTAYLIHINKVEGKVPIVSNEVSHSYAKGTWITLDYEKRKKKRKAGPWIVGIAIISVIAAAMSFFMCGGKNNTAEFVGKDSIKSESAKLQPIEQKKNSVKENSVVRPHQDAASEDNPLKNEKGDKDKMNPTKVEQPKAKLDKEKPDVVKKIVKPSQSTKAEKSKPINPNEKKI